MKLVFTATGRFRDGAFLPAAHGRVTVTAYDDAGAVTDRCEVSPSSPRSRLALTRKYKISDVEVLALCDTTKATGEKKEWTPAAEVAQPLDHVQLTIRDVAAPTGDDHRGPTLELLRRLLPEVPTDKLLVWKDEDSFVCLDVDYHEAVPPLKAHLETWVEARLKPKPACWHFSRGGGLHCFYVATGGFTARELACAAAIRYRLIDPTAGVELKKQVRGPGAEALHWSPPDTAGASGPILGSGEEADEQSVEEFLATHGLEMGARYPHERCPIDPGAVTTAVGDPVTVSTLGIYCHRCAGKGHTFGSRRPGFAPWTTLTGSPSGGDVGRMVRNLVHWGHARWVLVEKYGLPEEYARDGYSAALRAYHGERYTDAIKAAVFNRDTADMARSNDSWMNLTSGSHYATNTSMPLLASLPAALVETEKGLKPVPASVAYFAQGHSLAERGYTNIRTIHGYRMARQFLPLPGETHAQVLVPELRKNSRAPQYVPKSKRMSMNEAEGKFLSVFPGIEFNVLRTLVCAGAVAQETRLGMHPMLFLAGFTGAAKTSTCKLAAGITGTAALEITYTNNEERQKQSIAASGRAGSFALANEFLKDSYRANRRYDPRAALEGFLTVTPESLNHVLFVGAKKLGHIPAIVVTEPLCPPALRDYHQIARRFRFITLRGSKKIWENSFAKLGLTSGDLHLYRLKDAELALAADAIMSDLIDRYFSTAMPFGDMADDLGVPRLMDSTEFADETPHMRRLFRLVCKAPELGDPRLKKEYGRGWKLIHRTDTPDELSQELADVWTAFADTGHDGWVRSASLSEKSWSEILKVSEHVIIDISNRGSNMVLIRFRVGPPKNPLKLNGEITTLPEEDE